MKPEEFAQEWLGFVPVWTEQTRARMFADLAAVTQAAVEAERDRWVEVVAGVERELSITKQIAKINGGLASERLTQIYALGGKP